MSEMERPGERDEDRGAGVEGARAGVEPLAVRRARAPRRSHRRRAGMPSAIAERLRMLERRVEEALASTGAPAGNGESDLTRTLLDEALATMARLRRVTWREARLALRLFERDVAPVLRLLYRYWWRVEAAGIDRVPTEGPVLLVTNRGPGLVPYEPLMLREALTQALPGVAVRPLLDGWLFEVPVLGQAALRTGASAAAPASLRRHLGRGEAVVVQPEGSHAFAKPYRARYRLGRFTDGFARVAIELGTPIVPVAVIGAEEGQPVLARLDGVGRLLGLPTLPITPMLVPLPTKWRLHFGEALDVSAAYPTGSRRPAAAARLRDQVRERLQALILEGLRCRRSVFLG
jgi:1-acyl-sn-glycerol-3-phosphate acyltransferase